MHIVIHFVGQLQADYLLLSIIHGNDYVPKLIDIPNISVLWGRYLEKLPQSMICQMDMQKHHMEMNIPNLMHALAKMPYETGSVNDVEVDMVLEYWKAIYWVFYMYKNGGKCLDFRYCYPYTCAPQQAKIHSVYLQLVSLYCMTLTSFTGT